MWKDRAVTDDASSRRDVAELIDAVARLWATLLAEHVGGLDAVPRLCSPEAPTCAVSLAPSGRPLTAGLIRLRKMSSIAWGTIVRYIAYDGHRRAGEGVDS